MKKIALTQGKHALVDDDDFDRINSNKWYAIKSNRMFYAARMSQYDENGKRKIIRMHREVIGIADNDKRVVDHIDHNGLNNQRKNIRIIAKSDNAKNRRRNKNHLLPKGVWNTEKGYRATINVNKVRIHLGKFPTPELAAEAYNKAAIRFHGEFACTNS